MTLCSSPVLNASRATAQVGKFTAGGVGVVLEELLGLFVLRLFLLVSMVWQEKHKYMGSDDVAMSVGEGAPEKEWIDVRAFHP